jgi:hypothetical protein
MVSRACLSRAAHRDSQPITGECSPTCSSKEPRRSDISEALYDGNHGFPRRITGSPKPRALELTTNVPSDLVVSENRTEAAYLTPPVDSST